MRVLKKFRKAKDYQDLLRQFTPFAFYSAVMLTLGISSFASGPPAIPVISGLLLFGLLTWGLYEYLVHRFVLHRNPEKGLFAMPGNQTHLRHHENPEDLERLHVTLNESAPASGVYALLMWFLLGRWQTMAFAYIGFHFGYFFYEWLDYQAHHGAPNSLLIRYLKKYHLQHHSVDANRRFGVSSPLFDLLFGTFHLKTTRPLKSARRRRRA